MTSKPSWTYNKVKQFYTLPVDGDGLSAYFSHCDLNTSLVGLYKKDDKMEEEKDKKKDDKKKGKKDELNHEDYGIVSCYLKKPSSLAYTGNRCIINDMLRQSSVLTTSKGLPKGMRASLEKLLAAVEDRKHLRI